MILHCDTLSQQVFSARVCVCVRACVRMRARMNLSFDCNLRAERWHDAAVEGVLVGQAPSTPMAVKYIIIFTLKLIYKEHFHYKKLWYFINDVSL